MYKTLIAYLIIILFTGCSVSGRLGSNIEGDCEEEKQLIIESKSITDYSFLIQKADIEILTKDDRKSFIASVKYSRPDSFLISIRSKTGIEAARIFLTNDTILINDRLNKTLFYGNNYALKKKYGYGNELICFMLGGFFEDLRERKIIFYCRKGESYHSAYVDGMKVDYLLDCKAGEIKRIDIDSGKGENNIILNYFEKVDKGDFVFYKRIELMNIYEYELIKIEINRLEVPYEGRIEFIPGRNFQQVEIR